MHEAALAEPQPLGWPYFASHGDEAVGLLAAARPAATAAGLGDNLYLLSSLFHGGLVVILETVKTTSSTGSLHFLIALKAPWHWKLSEHTPQPAGFTRSKARLT